MDEITAVIGIAIAGMLCQASWRLAAVATKLDLLCDRLNNHEQNTRSDIARLHERVDGVETRLDQTQHFPPIAHPPAKGAKA
jgi:cob(I)alamin adenosyltransferase